MKLDRRPDTVTFRLHPMQTTKRFLLILSVVAGSRHERCLMVPCQEDAGSRQAQNERASNGSYFFSRCPRQREAPRTTGRYIALPRIHPIPTTKHPLLNFLPWLEQTRAPSHAALRSGWGTGQLGQSKSRMNPSHKQALGWPILFSCGAPSADFIALTPETRAP